MRTKSSYKHGYMRERKRRGPRRNLGFYALRRKNFGLSGVSASSHGSDVSAPKWRQALSATRSPLAYGATPAADGADEYYRDQPLPSSSYLDCGGQGRGGVTAPQRPALGLVGLVVFEGVDAVLDRAHAVVEPSLLVDQRL